MTWSNKERQREFCRWGYESRREREKIKALANRIVIALSGLTPSTPKEGKE